MLNRTKQVVQREVEVTEEVCDLTGETLAFLEDGGHGEVIHPYFRVHLELVGQRADGTPFTWRLLPDRAPRVCVREILKLFGAKLLGEWFPSLVFEDTGLGRIRRRKTTKGKPMGPEIGEGREES